MATGFRDIECCQLFFIVTTRSHPFEAAERRTSPFLTKMCAVFADEFSDEFNARSHRRLILREPARYRAHRCTCEVYVNDFEDFDCGLLYIRLSFDQSMPYRDFALLCSGEKYRDLVTIGDQTIFSAIGLTSDDLAGDPRSFLFSQVIGTSPALPSGDDAAAELLASAEHQINQLLLRSDSEAFDLRPANHRDKLGNIANFYGTIDFCSTHHLLQFYQRPVRSLVDDAVVDQDHRACWWLALMHILHLQGFVVREALDRVNRLTDLSDRDVVFEINEIDSVIRSIRRYWSLDELAHPMSRVVVALLRNRIGLEDRLAGLRERLQTTENIVLRGINEEQNRHNAVLNIILLIIAAFEFIPVIYAGIRSLRDPSAALDFAGWAGSAGIGLLLPVCILILGRVRSQRILKRLRASRTRNIA